MPASLKSHSARTQATYQTVDVLDLSGGLDLRRSPTLLGPDRARDLLNVSLATPGELAIRAGYRQFSTGVPAGAIATQGAIRAYLASTQFTLWTRAGNIGYTIDDGSQSAGVSTVSSTAVEVNFAYDRTIVAVFDSTNRPQKSTDGQTWTLMGIDASPTNSTASSVTNGSLSTSEFEFSFSYKDRGTGHESNICGANSTVTLTDTGAVELQCPNSTDGQVDAIVVYARNKTAGESVKRRASSFAVQGTTAAGQHSTVTITSSAWSANDEAPTNHNVPSAYRHAVIWKNRWWGADQTVGNRLHFTELFQPQSWPTLFYIDLPFEKGDAIRAMVPQGDTLVVFGDSKVYLIIGQTSLDFEVKPSAGAQAGALGFHSVAVIEHGIVHAAAEGIFIFDGATDTYLSYDIEPGWRDLIRNSAASDLRLIALVYHFTTKELRVAVPRIYPRSIAGEWVLDLNRTREKNQPAWASTDRPIGGYILFDGAEPATGFRGTLLSWDRTERILWKESTGTSANSSNMTMEYEGPHLAMGFHRARFVDVTGEYEPHTGAFTVETLIDQVSQGGVSINIGTGFAMYGSTTYGGGQYAGGGRRMFTHMLPLAAEGRTVWLKAAYSGQDSFRWFTYAIGLVPETAVRGFSE